MLPVSQNLSVNLNQMPECPCIYQKGGGSIKKGGAGGGGAGGGRGGSRPGCEDGKRLLPDIVKYESLDDFYVDVLKVSGVQR
jgi:hypothetical protein